MDRALHRSSLLAGDLLGSCAPARPPWALPERAFREACTGCGRCIEACPESILVAGRARCPSVDFRAGGCTFCGACADACGDGAIVRAGGASPWALVASIGAECLALAGVVCSACADACDRRAIRFRPAIGAAPRPALDALACNGCGACVAPCPASAIRVEETT